MQCKDCTHQAVCMHKDFFDTLKKMLPTTMFPFRATVTCDCYKQELPQERILAKPSGIIDLDTRDYTEMEREWAAGKRVQTTK